MKRTYGFLCVSIGWASVLVFGGLNLTAYADDSQPAHEEHEESENRTVVGPNKGVTVFSEDDGFKLSPEARKSFEIRTAPVTASTVIRVPKSAVVFSGASVSVYRLRSESFLRVPAKILKRNTDTFDIHAPQIETGDAIVVHGASSLRVAEMDVEGGDEAGHSH